MELQKLIYKPVSGQPVWFRLISGPLERLWALGARLKAFLWEKGLLTQGRLPGPCLSVGNLSVGGTGKSPVVMALVRMLRAKGLNPAVLTRGYGSDLKGQAFVCLKAGEVVLHQGPVPSRLPDEAMMQSLNLPDTYVIASPDRLGAARACTSLLDGAGIDFWILDDGFSHRKIHRDYDLVLVDHHSLFGNGRYLPQGFLREKPEALKRSSMVLLTRCPQAGPDEQVLQRIQGYSQAPCLGVPFIQGPPVHSEDQSPLPETDKPLFLTAGIVAPERLLEDLKLRGLIPEACYFVKDHESFAKKKHQKALRSLSEKGLLITTEKDFNRDRKFFTSLPGSVFILTLRIRLPEKEISELLKRPVTSV